MRKFLAGLVAAVLLLVPAAGSSYPGWWGFGSPAAVAKWVGCNAEVLVEDLGEMNAFFAVREEQKYVVLDRGLMEKAGEDGAMFAFLHELGHCLQYQERGAGIFFDDRRELEWEADVIAANMACAIKRDGPAAQRQTWDAFIAEDEDPDYESYSHGSINQRIDNVERRAETCKPHGQHGG